jgi:hypothetical protein
VNEWLFRSFLRWAASVGVEEVKRLAAEGLASHVHQGGRMLTATAHGGKSATFTFPAELGIASLNEILEKAIWMLENFNEDGIKDYLMNYPSATAHSRFGYYYP